MKKCNLKKTLNRTPTSALMLALEPRFMFDAAGVATGTDIVADQAAQQQVDQALSTMFTVSDQTVVADNIATDSQGTGAKAVVTDKEAADTSDKGALDSTVAEQSIQTNTHDSAVQLADALSTHQANTSDRQEIVFIDTRVVDYQSLLNGIDPSAQVVLLDSSRDGIAQIAETLSSYQHIDAIYLISHGSAGQISLGSAVLNNDTMNSLYADSLKFIGSTLSDDAEIFIYGYDIASDNGNFNNQLARLTSADVSVPTDVSKCMDWVTTDTDIKSVSTTPNIEICTAIGVDDTNTGVHNTTNSLLVLTDSSSRYTNILSSAEKLLQERLTTWFQKQDAISQLAIPFGATAASFEWTFNAQALKQSILGGSYSIRIEVDGSIEMQSALGAYSFVGTTNQATIYLNADLLANGSAESIQAVILEELGHDFDHYLNGTLDSKGDEGALFSALVSDTVLSPEQLSRIQTEDDTSTIQIDGQRITVERAVDYSPTSTAWRVGGRTGDPLGGSNSNDGGWTAAAADLVGNASNPYIAIQKDITGVDTTSVIAFRVRLDGKKAEGQTGVFIDLNGDGNPDFSIEHTLIGGPNNENNFNALADGSLITGTTSELKLVAMFANTTDPLANTRPNNTEIPNENFSSGAAYYNIASPVSYAYKTPTGAVDVDADNTEDVYHVFSFTLADYNAFLAQINAYNTGVGASDPFKVPPAASYFSNNIYFAGVTATNGLNSINGDIGGGAYTTGNLWVDIFGAGREINVTGLSVNILDGDITPSSTDATDFGSTSVGTSVDKTFTIQNTGTGPLVLGSISVPTGYTIIGTNPTGTTLAEGTSITLTVRLTALAIGTYGGEINIVNNDFDENPYNFQITGIVAAAPTLSINDITVNEATGTATFTVTRSGATGAAASVDYSTSNGSATAGSDYTAIATGTVNFAIGETSKTISVDISNDSVFEGSETFNVNLTNATGATISDNQGVGTIKDDGTGTGGTDNDTPTLSITSPTVTEGSPAVFTVSLSNASTTPVSFTPSLVNGAATVGTDTAAANTLEVSTNGGVTWTTVSGAVTIAAGQTSVQLRLATTDDSIAESSEDFTLVTGAITGTVTNATGVTGTGTITDNDTTLITDMVNNAPAATDDIATMQVGTAVSGNVLSNDSDIDGDALLVARYVIDGKTYNAGSSAVLVTGTLLINTDGTFIFTSSANSIGPVPVITYTITDGQGNYASAILILEIKSDVLFSPDNLWNAGRGIYTERFRDFDLSTVEMDVTPNLPVISAVSDASDLNSVTSIGVRSSHSLLQEIKRISNIEFLSDRLNGLLSKFAVNQGEPVNHPISQEIDRIEHVLKFDDVLQRVTDIGRSSWGLGSLRYSLTLLPDGHNGNIDDYLTVHTTHSGTLLYIEIEHTVQQHPCYDVKRYSASFADGRPLPDWLSFDSATGILSGIPTVGEEMTKLRVSVELDNGTTFSSYVQIEPDSGRIIELKNLPGPSKGMVTFVDQIRQSAGGFEAELTRLRESLKHTT